MTNPIVEREPALIPITLSLIIAAAIIYGVYRIFEAVLG